MSILFFLQGIPETIGTIALSLALARISLRWIPVVLAGTVIAIVGAVIRTLPVALGLNSIAMILLHVIFLAKMTIIPPAKSFILAIISVLVLIMVELTIHLGLFNLINLDPKTIDHNSLLWYLIGLPQALLVLFIAILIHKLKKPVADGWKI